MSNQKAYFSYLRQRSTLGLIYRKYWLYPRLCSCLEGRVLDVGCGIGDFVAFRNNTVGVDINPENVAWCKENALNVRLMEQDKLPFSPGEFSGVMLDNVLEHIQYPNVLLQEIRRVLISAGRIVIGVPGRKGYDSDPDHKIYYNENDLVSLMHRSEFKLDRIFYMPLKWEWLDTRMRQYCMYGVFHKKQQ